MIRFLKLFKHKKKKRKAFSLVELIVVISIMVVLSAVLIPSLIMYVEHSREQKDLSAMSELRDVFRDSASANMDAYDELRELKRIINEDQIYVTYYPDGNGMITAASGKFCDVYTLQDVAPNLLQCIKGDGLTDLTLKSAKYKVLPYTFMISIGNTSTHFEVTGDWVELSNTKKVASGSSGGSTPTPTPDSGGSGTLSGTTPSESESTTPSESESETTSVATKTP